LYNASQGYDKTMEKMAGREAMLERFVRAAETVALQTRLHQTGTASQKAAFERLRRAEARNPLKAQ
jgi:hypothetical protein